jgi:DNA-binding SARP family transcriptional activator
MAGTVDGRLLDLGPPKRRLVLAALLVDAGRTVTLATLIDRVWGEAPPAEVRGVVYAHVARIRRMLGATDCARLKREGGGYLLEVVPESVDLHRFRRLVEQARHLGSADPRHIELLREALRLWRGPALTGLPGGWAERVRMGAEQQRLGAVVAWAQAELRHGRAADVVGDLYEIADEHPLVEPLLEVLMQALIADGRAAEALSRYTVARERLVAELGTEPGPTLRRLNEAILRGDLHNELPGPSGPATPAQLPPDVPGFIGRATELRFLHEMSVDSSTVVIAAIAGGPGVGKPNPEN